MGNTVSYSKAIWIPRVLTIIYIIFISMFSLDVFQSGKSIWIILGGFVVHNFPSIILLLIFILTWNRPLIIGIFYTVISIIFTFFFKTYHEIYVFLFISLPPFAAGASYLIIFFTAWKASKEPIDSHL